MPEALERALKKIARKRKYSKERTGAYVYGTMRKTGWKPQAQRAGRASSRKGARTR